MSQAAPGRRAGPPGPGSAMVRVRDGQVVEHWAILDQAAIAEQLGGDS